MRLIFQVFLFFLVFQSSLAQPFAVGHRSINLLDVVRNRTVTAEVYYPAITAGDNVAFALGSFPVFTLAHGFVIPGNTYQNFADELVPDGYVVVLPTTESGFLPNHDAFGKDIAFLNTSFRSGAIDFFTQWNGRSAIGGHSMGGGASALAATQTLADAYVGLAPAITNPSPVPVGSQIQIPAIIFSGSADGVTPPETNHLPIYDSFGSSCKTFVSINAGTHCFYIPSSLCDLGESGIPGGMTREIQQDITFDFLRPFLQTFLRDDSSAWQQFQQALPADNRVTYQQTCSINFTGMDLKLASITHMFPQPCTNLVNLKFSNNLQVTSAALFSLQGQCISSGLTFMQQAAGTMVELPTCGNGFFILELRTNRGILRHALMVSQP
jgi:hypothetical protein